MPTCSTSRCWPAGSARQPRGCEGAGVAPDRVAYFGASTGAAAALWAAAQPGADVAAIVSRGGRPDLARARLGEVTAPTLLIVGSHDHDVLDLNRAALACLGGTAQLALVSGATHLFEEPGALQAVADLARDWFLNQLTPPDLASDRAWPPSYASG